MYVTTIKNAHKKVKWYTTLKKIYHIKTNKKNQSCYINVRQNELQKKEDYQRLRGKLQNHNEANSPRIPEVK